MTAARACQAYIPELQFAECSKPATAQYVYGCVHEHIVQRWVCPEHHPQEGLTGCIQCLVAGHECPMTFRPVSPKTGSGG